MCKNEWKPIWILSPSSERLEMRVQSETKWCQWTSKPPKVNLTIKKSQDCVKMSARENHATTWVGSNYICLLFDCLRSKLLISYEIPDKNWKHFCTLQKRTNVSSLRNISPSERWRRTTAVTYLEACSIDFLFFLSSSFTIFPFSFTCSFRRGKRHFNPDTRCMQKWLLPCQSVQKFAHSNNSRCDVRH